MQLVTLKSERSKEMRNINRRDDWEGVKGRGAWKGTEGQGNALKRVRKKMIERRREAW